MTQDTSRPLHPNFQWAVQAAVLTWAEARLLSQVPVWMSEVDMDETTAALARRYLHWLVTTERAQ
jgi:hypothetical protein